MHPNDPALKSFIEVAKQSDFPIQNLPFGIFSTAAQPQARAGVAIGDQVLDLSVLEARGLLKPAPHPVFNDATLNAFIALGRPVSRARRKVGRKVAVNSPDRRRGGGRLGRSGGRPRGRFPQVLGGARSLPRRGDRGRQRGRRTGGA
jgi:fumarylacetoacetase